MLSVFVAGYGFLAFLCTHFICNGFFQLTFFDISSPGACNSPETFLCVLEGKKLDRNSDRRFISFVKDFCGSFALQIPIPQRIRHYLPEQILNCLSVSQSVSRSVSIPRFLFSSFDPFGQSTLVMASWQMFNICTPVFYLLISSWIFFRILSQGPKNVSFVSRLAFFVP